MVGSYPTLSELSQTSNPSARPIPGSGYIAQIILGVLVLAFVWISELISDLTSTTSKTNENTEGRVDSNTQLKELAASNLDTLAQSIQLTTRFQQRPSNELEKIESASKKASLVQDGYNASLVQDGYRVWKNQAGKELFAKMLSFDGANLVLKTEDGKTHSYSQSGLSASDQLENRHIHWSLCIAPNWPH
jgi:hypothetical protein